MISKILISFICIFTTSIFCQPSSDATDNYPGNLPYISQYETQSKSPENITDNATKGNLANPEEGVTAKQTILHQLSTWQIPNNLGYPRLYFDSNTIKPLNTLYLAGSSRIKKLLSECDSLITRPIPDYSNFDLSRYKARNEAEKLSFAFAITRKSEYSDYAKKLVHQIIQWPVWVYEEHKPRRVDLGVAGVAYILALCYDWLYPTLTPLERLEIENTIIEKALLPFHDVYRTKSEGWTHATHNWRSVICGEMGVVTLTLLEKVPHAKQNLEFAIDGVVDVLSHGGIDGGWNEGVSYWGYGVGQAMMFVDAMHRVSGGAVNLYQLPFLKHTGDFGLYCRTPDGNSFNYSDCNPGPPKPWLLALLASHYQNPYWQWSAQKEIGNSIPDILFYNADLRTQKPADLVLAKHFQGTEIVTMRSTWDDDALFIGFKSGQTIANHSHLDLNSFVLHAHGKPLLIDQNVWPYAHYLGFFEEQSQRWDFEGNHTVAHNTLLVDGQGQRYGEAFDGRIINFSSAPELQFAVGEANVAYGALLNKFHRYITLVDGKIVVIVDDVAADEIHQLEWLMHYDGKVMENPDGTFTISNKDVRLDVQFLRPSKQDNRVVSFELHETTYKATRETTIQSNRFVSVRPLHKQQDYRFVATLLPYKENEFSTYSSEVIEELENSLTIRLVVNDADYVLQYDFRSQTIHRLY